MSVILDHFDALTDRGLKVIPLRTNSKAPMYREWQKDWSRDFARAKLQEFPDANLGLILGEVIDVEGDSDRANRLLLNLISDYPHPCYQSTKSIHHLFLNPVADLRHFRWEEIEFRGHGHQSVIPPSQHQGIKYRWLESFRFPVPPMPAKLLSFYEAKIATPRKDPRFATIWCVTCRKKFQPHRNRLTLEEQAFQALGQKWQCHDCRTIDLRDACRLLRKLS